MATTPSAQASAMIVELDQVNGLLTPLIGLNIPIPFMEVDQLIDDTPHALNSASKFPGLPPLTISSLLPISWCVIPKSK
jgi:hypothetical protein